SDSPHAAMRTSPIRCCRRCDMNSAATSRRRQARHDCAHDIRPGVPARCRQHAARQRPDHCGPASPPRIRIRARERRALLVDLRSPARAARLCRLPWRVAALSRRPRARQRPPPAADIELPRRLPVRPAPLPTRARGRGPPWRIRPHGHPLGRRCRVPAAQGAALRAVGRRARTRADLHPQGADAERGPAAPSGSALRHGGRQAAHPGRDEDAVERSAHHRLPAPGPLRTRCGHPRAPSGGRHLSRTHRRSARCRHRAMARAVRRCAALTHAAQTMNAKTHQLHRLGQRLWLDNISREILLDGTLSRYIAELSVTGLTSNPTIFEKAIGKGSLYDRAIADLARRGQSGEELFFSLAIEDLRQAADLFRPIHDATHGIDGWVSLEVSPLLAYDTAKSIEAAAHLHAAGARANLFIKIPGTQAGIPAIEESIFAGVPINVTLLFSREQYVAAAEAYMRGIERRIAAGLD